MFHHPGTLHKHLSISNLQITLKQLLESRDRRAARQAELLGQYPGRTLLCLTVMLPGPVKRSNVSLKIASAAVSAVRFSFDLQFEELRDLETGYEGYFVVDIDPVSAKRQAVSIEEEHPLGRLFDLDVITADGPLSREGLGLPGRKCLICGKPVRECMRTRAHSTEELLERISVILNTPQSF